MKRKKRKTIGVCIDWIESPYHIELISALEERARQLDVNLLSIVGGALHSSQKFEASCNVIYDFINNRNTDGILIASGSLGHYCSSTELVQFCKSYSPIPVVSISQSLPNIVSVISDNTAGLKALIQHLITAHGYKKIGFIKGIEGNQDAEQRFDTYKQTLLSNHIPYKQEFVAPGDFTQNAGRKAVRLFLKKRELMPDVLVAANDEMAIGAIEELCNKKIHVPYDIAVVGFDDQPASATTTPPLTTVRQNIGKQGIKALEVIIDMINNKKAEPLTMIPTEVVIRQSCGCSEGALLTIHTLAPNKIKHIQKNQGNRTNENKEEILTAFNSAVHASISPISLSTSDMEELVHAFITDINNSQEESFLVVLNKLIVSSIKNRITGKTWIEVISCLVKATLPYTFQKETLTFIENLFFRAQFLIMSRLPEKRIYTRSEIDDQIKLFSGLTEGIVGTVDIKSIINLLSMAGPQMKILKCYFAIFSQQDVSQSKLLLAYDQDLNTFPRLLGTEFPSHEFIPDQDVLEKRPYNLRVHPFLRNGIFLGFTVFEFTPSSDMLQNLLRKLFLSGILKGVFIYESMKTEAERLESLVNERTKDLKQTEIKLKETNKNLTKTLKEFKHMQKELVESEKMAALGSLVAGVAHEINTPIGIGVTAASHLLNTTNTLFNRFIDQKITKTELNDYIETAQEASSMILTNLRRAYELIRSFKDVAVDQSSENIRDFNVKNYIQNILLSLRPQLKKVNHSIIIDCPDDLSIVSFPGAFSQILTNLIINSLTHAYDENDKGKIAINIKMRDSVLYFIYSDDGKGIEEPHLQKIFEPFFTTNRNKGGTGLGLHLVYNIVKQRLSGTITCKSEKEKGARFIITIPVGKQKTD